MATAPKKEVSEKEKLFHLVEAMEDEFRWCANHPNDVSLNELEQLKDGIDELDKKFKLIGGKFYEHFLKFRKKFDFLATHINKLKAGDYQHFDEMVQHLFKDLK